MIYRFNLRFNLRGYAATISLIIIIFGRIIDKVFLINRNREEEEEEEEEKNMLGLKIYL